MCSSKGTESGLVEQDYLQVSLYRSGTTGKKHSPGKGKQTAKERAAGSETAAT